MLCTALIVITLFQFTPLREGRRGEVLPAIL